MMRWKHFFLGTQYNNNEQILFGVEYRNNVEGVKVALRGWHTLHRVYIDQPLNRDMWHFGIYEEKELNFHYIYTKVKDIKYRKGANMRE